MPSLPFQMANLKDLPESLDVIGGGVIGIEYATVLAQLGVPATVICKQEAFLPFLPQELRDACKADMVRRPKHSHGFIHKFHSQAILT